MPVTGTRAPSADGAAGNERLTAMFVLWFGVMTIHVLVYGPRLPRLLLGGPPAGRAAATLAGRGTRWLLLAAALAGGLVIAMATLHLAATWRAV
jgi:hypothetical protein